jgi:hypothetical protein
MYNHEFFKILEEFTLPNQKVNGRASRIPFHLTNREKCDFIVDKTFEGYIKTHGWNR